MSIIITINGETFEDIPAQISVAGLLAHLNMPEGKIAVERNLEIVSKSLFKETILQQGDKLEIIHFIGGG